VAGEGDVGTGRQRVAALGQHHGGAGQVGQVGPGVRDVGAPGIGDAAAPQAAQDALAQPGARGRVVDEVAGAQDDDAQAVVFDGGAKGALHLDAHPALAGDGPLRRVRAPGRGLRSEIVDVAGHDQRGARGPRGGDGERGDARHLGVPVAVVGRIHAVDDHVGARRGGLRGVGPAVVAAHGPAGGLERGGGVAAEAAGGAEDENGSGHHVLLGSG